MVIKYHTLRLLNDILPPEIKESDTQLQWLKSLINPINERQIELNTEQDIILRDMKHNGQQGVIDHWINKIQYPNIAGDVFFNDKDIVEELIIYTDSESPSTQPYIYTDSGVTSGVTTNFLYLITDDETGYNYSSFEVLIPDMYEDTDTQYGIEYWVNKYKPAGKTFDTYFFSGSTTADIQTGFTNFETLDFTYYTSDNESFDDDLQFKNTEATLKLNHTLIPTWASDTFFYSLDSTNYIICQTDFAIVSGLAKSQNFDVESGKTYNVRYEIQYYDTSGNPVTSLNNNPGNNCRVTFYDSISNTITWNGFYIYSSSTGLTTYTHNPYADDNYYARLDFTNANDYESFEIQLFVEEQTDIVTFTKELGYRIDFDVDTINYNNGFINAADTLAYSTGITASVKDDYTKYTGQTYLGSTDATYYNFDYETTGATSVSYKAANFVNVYGCLSVLLEVDEISNISGLTAKFKAGSTLISSKEIGVGDTLWIPEFTSGLTTYFQTINFYLDWDNMVGTSTLDMNLSFQYNSQQKFNMNIIDGSGNTISNVSPNITETGSYSIPLSVFSGSTNGSLQLNIDNRDLYTKGGDNETYSKNTAFEISNLIINEIDYSIYVN